MMFCISCQSNLPVEKNVYYVPEIVFPEFPKLAGYEILDDGDIVVHANFFRELLSFKLQYEDLIDEYAEKKNAIEQGE